MDQRYLEILNEAERIFKKFGIRSVSMDDVCRELGISKKTLYLYVENKEDLVEKVILKSQEEIRKEFEQIIRQAENAIDQLLQVSLLVSRKFSDVNLAFSHDLSKYFPHLCKNEQSNRRQHIFEHIQRNMQLGIKQGYFRTDLQVDMVARLYVQKIENVMNSEHLLSEEFSSADFFKVMFENHIHGIANEKGISYFEEKIKSLNIKI
ncbi:TetR/AcrR family transcriptional regulator [Bacteroidota bacterium]